MFEFAASSGALSQKRLHQKRSLFWNCLVIAGGKFKHHKFLENVKFEETNNKDSILEVFHSIKIRWIAKTYLLWAQESHYPFITEKELGKNLFCEKDSLFVHHCKIWQDHISVYLMLLLKCPLRWKTHFIRLDWLASHICKALISE